MNQGYLTQESARVKKAARKTVLRSLIVLICALAVIYILGKDSIDFHDLSIGSVGFILIILVGIALVTTVINLIVTSKPAVNGKNLILPYGETSKEDVGKIIDAEAAEGRIIVEEYIYEFADGKKAYGEKIVLTPSYLMLCSQRVTAIPRDKIYWICAQVGHKGDSYRVRLLVFTENKIFNLTGVDIQHVQNIAQKLYQYIPNVFAKYDPSALSYELEKVFKNNPEEFFNFYDSERKEGLLG